MNQRRKTPVPSASEALVLRHVAADLAPAPVVPAAVEAAVGALWSELESEESQRAYKRDWRRYCDWLDTQGIAVTAATPAIVQRYVNHMRDDLGNGKATRSRSLSVLRAVYRALNVAGQCAINPAREVKNPKMSTDPVTPWLNEMAVQKFFAAATGDKWRDRRDRAIVLCLALLGVRRAEVARLCVEDFSIDATSVMLLVKRGKRPTVGVPGYLANELRVWRAFAGITTGALFPKSETDSAAIKGRNVYDAVKRIAHKAGLDVTPHAMRRTFATILSRRGVELRSIQLALSHESITTTERYRKTAEAASQAPGQEMIDLIEPPKQ